MQRICLTLDLHPDPVLIERYIAHHEAVWPEIKESIRDAGVLEMQIYFADARLFMIMETTDEFTLERKAAMDSANPKVIEWERLMGQFQKVTETSDPTKRWVPLKRIFQLS